MAYMTIDEAAEALTAKHASTGAELLAQLEAQRAKDRARTQELIREQGEPSEETFTVRPTEGEPKPEADIAKGMEKAHRKIFTEQRRREILEAVRSGELVRRDPESKLPLRNQDVRTFHDLLDVKELDAWLKGKGSTYRLEDEALVASDFQEAVWERADRARMDLLSSLQRQPTNSEIVKAIKAHFDAKGMRDRSGKLFSISNLEARLKGWRKARQYPNAPRARK